MAKLGKEQVMVAEQMVGRGVSIRQVARVVRFRLCAAGGFLPPTPADPRGFG